jgi:hypothetical protein
VTRKNLEFDDKNTYLEDLPCGTGMDPQGLVQRIVERGPMISKLLPQHLFSLGLVEVSRWRVGGLLLLLQACHSGIWGGAVGV